MAGRKNIKIDWAKYDELKNKGLKDIQIAKKLGVSQTTLSKKKQFRNQI
ncbi:helix-turn-helix family protein [Clostridium botulinum]|nr:hypothetical protein [Clostridium botulinum]RUT53978.1 helix-turn-helix family protein [Clostridium botulinum]